MKYIVKEIRDGEMHDVYPLKATVFSTEQEARELCHELNLLGDARYIVFVL